MNRSSRPTPGLLLSFLVAAATATGEAQSPAAPTAAALFPEGLRVPIHTHPDNPPFGPYGLWAAGPDYKASFHDGFAFYPYLGPDYPENLPLHWRTESIEAGGEVLVTAATKAWPRTSEWRHEVHHAGVVEAYDVRADGVEQTFQLLAPPVRGGDWVVTGRITTRLVAPSLLAAMHQEIVFTDAQSRPLVRYGKATAIDAAGDRHAVTTSFDGWRIRLTVDGAWLATARFPVLLDPLSTAVQVYASGTQGVLDLELASTNFHAGQSQVMVVFARAFSATDRDAYGLLTTPSWTGATIVFSEINAVTNSEKTAVAYSSTTQRWVIAFQRSLINDPSVCQIRAWVHAPDNTGTMVGVSLTAPGTTDRNPDVGGGTNSGLLVVYQTDVTATGSNTPNTEIHGAIVQTSGSPWVATPFRIPGQLAGTRFDRENPAVNQTRSGAPTSWVVVWQELDRNTAGDDWDIWGRRFASIGGPVGTAADLTASAGGGAKIQPAIDGDNGRFMVSYLLASSATATSGPELRTIRCDAPDNGSTVTALVHGVLRSSTTRAFSNPAIAYDRNTRSHWAIVYESRATTSPGALPAAEITRVGYTGGVVESATLVANALSGFFPAVTDQSHTFQETNRFLVVYGAPAGLGRAVYARGLDYAATNPSAAYGTRCGPGLASTDVTRAGDEEFWVSLSSAPVATSAVLLLSTGPDSIPLDSAGMTGCFFNVSPAFLLPFVSVTDGSGSARVTFPLPDRPAFFGDLYFQWIYVNPGANPANLQATYGLRAEVR